MEEAFISLLEFEDGGEALDTIETQWKFKELPFFVLQISLHLLQLLFGSEW